MLSFGSDNIFSSYRKKYKTHVRVYLDCSLAEILYKQVCMIQYITVAMFV